MKSNEDGFYLKIIDLDVSYSFLVDKFCFKIVTSPKHLL